MRSSFGLLLCLSKASGFGNHFRALSKRGMTQVSSLDLLDFDSNLLHRDLREEMSKHIKTAQQHGVKHFVVPGSTLDDSEKALELSKTCSPVGTILATVGIHPYQAAAVEFNEISLGILRRLAEDESARAIGECGLDFSEGFPARDSQVVWFRAQVELALERELPLYLHIRGAHSDFVKILHDYDILPGRMNKVEICVHCFTGTTEELRVYCQDYGFYVSLSGHVIKNSGTINLEEWLSIIPPEKLLIETDAPYLGWKGCRRTESTRVSQNYPNVPASLIQIAERVAAARGCDLTDVATLTTQNALRFLQYTKVGR